MHIKRFEAPTIEEAIRRVKEELGSDALVLSRRSVRRDGGIFGWFGRPVVEIVAAVDREPLERSSVPSPDASWRGLALTKALIDPLEAELRALRRMLDGLAGSRSQQELQREVIELRRSVAELALRIDRPSHPARHDVAARLEAAGFSSSHANALAQEAEKRVGSKEDPSAPSLQRSVRERLSLTSVLADRLDHRLPPPREDDPSRISLFVGATGVGKTTSLAKLAARQSVHAEDIALITTDTYRIGADEQLRILAHRLGARFQVAVSPADLVHRIDRLGRRRILVDTAGRSRTDRSAVPDLVRCRDALGRRVQVQLVLSATTGRKTLRAEVDRFQPLRPDSLIVTKVDESENLASLAELLLSETSPPLAWLGTGQRVPEDLEVPDPEKLAVQMLGVAG